MLIAALLTVASLPPWSSASAATLKTTLHSFCSQGYPCAGGDHPEGGVIMDAAGNLYGTTNIGGSDAFGSGSGGTVFELTPNAAKTAWTHKVL